MSDSGHSDKPRYVNRRYLLDRPSQISVTVHLLSVLAGIGLLYAVAVYVLLPSDLLDRKSMMQLRKILLGVHTAYFVVGGAILAVMALLLTHRYAGPAFVMQRAVQAMRQGDYSSRLNLRLRDFHKPLAKELALLRDELAAKEAARSELLRELERALDAGKEPHVRALLAQLQEEPGAPVGSPEKTEAAAVS